MELVRRLSWTNICAGTESSIWALIKSPRKCLPISLRRWRYQQAGYFSNEYTGLKGNDSFIVETTFSGKSFTKALELAVENGFEVTIIFIFTDSPETSVERIAKRVKAGGHHVPDKDVRRRFARSMRNFWILYRPLAHFWLLAYTGETSAVQVANGGPNTLSLHDEEWFRKFLDLAGIDCDDTT